MAIKIQRTSFSWSKFISILEPDDGWPRDSFWGAIQLDGISNQNNAVESHWQYLTWINCERWRGWKAIGNCLRIFNFWFEFCHIAARSLVLCLFVCLFVCLRGDSFCCTMYFVYFRVFRIFRILYFVYFVDVFCISYSIITQYLF